MKVNLPIGWRALRLIAVCFGWWSSDCTHAAEAPHSAFVVREMLGVTLAGGSCSWTPDSQGFVCGDAGGRLIRVDAQTGAQRSLGEHIVDDSPIVAPQGDRLFYWGRDDRASSRFDLIIMHEVSGKPRIETIARGVELSVWAPDGEAVLLVANKQMIRYSLRDGTRKILCPFPRRPEVADVMYCADGRTLAIGETGLRWMSPEQKVLRQIAEFDGVLLWCADEREAWAAAIGGGHYLLHIGGTSIGRVSLPDDIDVGAFRHDGAAMVGMMRGGGIGIYDPASGAVERISSDPGDKAPTWSPDGRQILFLRCGKQVALGERCRVFVAGE